MDYAKPVLGFAAFSGTGKTTLLKQLIPQLAERGIRLGVIKHAHHNFDIDKPGKDSFELRKAGARQMLVASSRRWALMTETGDHNEPQLDYLLGRLDPDGIDLVLVEGFKHVPFPRIELHRPSLNYPMLHPDDPGIIAVASDTPLDTGGLTWLDLNDVGAIAAFVQAWLQEQKDHCGK
jgi:molybdopterin-guanine dinucleotide biosynthesis protein MobB